MNWFTQIVNRPPISSFAAGFFIEDHKFINSEDLDSSNGRYCKTPDFPNGTYAYFAGINSLPQNHNFHIL